MNIISDQPIHKLLKNHKNIILLPNLKENDSIDKSQAILTSSEDNEIETHNIMGFIGMGEDRLVITSRFDHDKPWFLEYLLKRVLRLSTINLEFDMSNKKSYLDFLPFLFPYYLKKALSKGLYKEYIKKEFNDAHVKGAINVKKHLDQNLPFNGNISYQTREFNYDNPVNQIIRHTIEYINHQCGYKGILDDSVVKHFVNQIIDITVSYHPKDLIKVIQHNKQKPIRNTYFKAYYQLVVLCIRILLKDKVNIDESDNHSWGILFDGAWLWEEYVNLLVEEYYYHPKNRTNTDPQYLFESNLGQIFPDFISRNNVNRKIMDAKYKPQINIRSDDYSQILSYMLRFDSNEGIFVYPEVNKNNTIKELKLKIGIDLYNEKSSTRSSPEVIVSKIPISIPRVESELEFIEHMKVIEIEFVNKII